MMRDGLTLGHQLVLGICVTAASAQFRGHRKSELGSGGQNKDT